MSKKIEKLIKTVSERAQALGGEAEVIVTPTMAKDNYGFTFEAKATVSADDGAAKRTVTDVGYSIEGALKNLAATLDRVADWDLVCAYIRSGVNRLPFESIEYATAWGLADGFGSCTAEEAKARGFFGDWSHFRDSSDEATKRVAAYLRAFERTGSKLSGHTHEVRPEQCQF